MDTVDFLRRILPKNGHKVLATPRPAPYKGFKHTTFRSLSEMAEAVAEINDEGDTAYHACAGFIEPSVTVMRRDRKTGELVERAAVRIADNAGWAKSFWVDLDVDAEDEAKYTSQREAVAGLVEGLKQAKLPAPMLVSSGYGIHAYWPLTKDIEAKHWVKVALRLKGVLHRVGVKQDPTRTADIASVLRPVGSINFKNGGRKEVRLVRDCPDIEAKDFVRAVLAAVDRLGVVPPQEKVKSVNSDLVQKVEYPPSSAIQIAEKCAALANFRDRMGDVEEPYWRASLGLIKFTVEGDDLAHEWSSGHPDYDKYDTAAKLDGWRAGPPTCATFECFGKCEGCPSLGKIKSPISLGLVLPKQQEVVQPARLAPAPVVVADTPFDGKLPPMPESMQDEFSYSGNRLIQRRIDGDKVKMIEVCMEYLVPHTIIRPTGDAKQGNRALLKLWRFTISGRREEITLPYAAVAAGGKDLVVALGDVGIAAEVVGMQKYMRGWLNELKQSQDDSLSIERMGWAGDNFVIGSDLYTPEGRVKASVSSSLQGYQHAFTRKGDVAEWTRLIQQAYGAAGQEQYQFLIGTGFGAPLLPFVGDYRGVVISAVSYKSGQGKTTAQRAAMSIYGDPTKLETAYGRQTTNAMFEKLGAMGNLPFMVDEITNIKRDELSPMVYAISQGVQKDRLTKAGDMKAQREPWQTLVPVSGNRSLVSVLGSEGHQGEPEMMRVFEFTFESVSTMSKNEADKLFNDLRHHYGVAGAVYADFLVKNKDRVAALVEKVNTQVNDYLQLTAPERFWGAAITCVLAGVKIANTLGLVSFDIKALMGWVRTTLNELRQQVRGAVGDESEVLNRLMADVNFDLWVTATMVGRKNGKPDYVVREPRRGSVAGRLVQESGLLLLRPEYIKAWCEKHRADVRLIKRMLTEEAGLRQSAQPRDLMTGIAGVAPQRGRFWELDANLLGDVVSNSPVVDGAGNVVPLRQA